MKIKTIALLAASVAAFFVGVWFFVSPSFNRQADIEAQGELLEIFTAIIGEQTIPQEPTMYIEETESEIVKKTYATPQFIEVFPETTPLPILEPEIATLDLSEFPYGIIPLGILTVESIDLRLPIMDGIDETALQILPGRIPQTAVIGEIGNAVIIGHRNYTFGSMFNRLGEVEIGDVVEFQAINGAVSFFEVFEILTIVPENQIAFVQPQDESIITLYTCTPVRVASHRLIIRAIKIEEGFNE
jgi:sortase A